VIAQHGQVIGRRPRILILRRQRVAREEEHLLRRVEEPRAAWLARRLLELLEAQRATGAAEEVTAEFGREDHDVAVEIGGTAGNQRRRRALGRRRREHGAQVDDLEVLGPEVCPEDVDLLGTVEGERAHSQACRGRRRESDE